jgi:hypothetical protein
MKKYPLDKHPWLGFLVFFFLVSLKSTVLCGALTSSLFESEAYQRYIKRPDSELSKLIYLIDRFVGQDIKVVYDGNEYDAPKAARYAKKYLAQHYDENEQADRWLKIHAYRSSPGGNIIYLKYADGESRVMIDVLLEELQRLHGVRSRVHKRT